MAIFPFSTKTKRPEDEEMVLEIKEHCERKNLNFSGLVVNLLRKYKQEHMDNHNER
jgi:hypothetical protein